MTTLEDFRTAAIESGVCTDVSEIQGNYFSFTNREQPNTCTLVPPDLGIDSEHVDNAIYHNGVPVATIHYRLNMKGLRAFKNRLD